MNLVEKAYLALALACLAFYPVEPILRFALSRGRLSQPRREGAMAMLRAVDAVAVYGALLTSGVFFMFVSLLLKYSRSPLAVWSLLALTAVIQVYLMSAVDARLGRLRQQVAYDPYYLKFDAATR